MSKFGLTLGGGGARGSAHIGVLLELERLGFKPDLITGTSIGGLMAVLLGCGLGVDDITDFMAELQWTKVYKLPRKLPAIASNQPLVDLLIKTIGQPTFADLSLPVAVVAADVKNQREAVISEGPVLPAILATTAIPAVLPPVEHNGSLFVDGGVVNNTPYDVAYAMGADRVLAVDLSNVAPLGTIDDPSEEGNVLDHGIASIMQYPAIQVVLSTFDLFLIRSLETRLEHRRPEVLLRPELGTIGALDFYRLQEGIEVGRAAVNGALDEIKTQFEL